MKIIIRILAYLFAAIMVLAGIAHLIKPAVYVALVPAFLPAYAVIYISGVLEFGIGLGIFLPRFRSIAALLLFIMMVGYLPLHIWDVFREKPAIGSHELALVRLPIQFVLIIWAWFIYKRAKFLY
jgi:uncharacterized membrane protein